MPKRLTGINPLAYRGVEAVQPPNIVESSGATVRQPTTSDYYEYNEGDLWMVKRDPLAAVPNELWYLARKTGTVNGPYADWKPLYPQGGGGGGGNLRSDDALISVPDGLGAINIWGGNAYVPGSDIRLGDPNYVNIYTAQFPDINTLEVVLKRSINQPLTNQTATEGMYSLGGTNFMHNFANTAMGGDHNTWLGHSAGNLTMTSAAENVGIGYNALRDTATAAFCTALGSGALSNIDDGQYCIGIGYNAGTNLDFADSDDIMIGNEGVLGDLNTIRIGKMPFPNPLVPPGAGEQNQVFLAGVWNSPAVPAINTGLVIVDDKGQLYVDDVPPNSLLVTDAGGNCVGLKGPVGTVLTGHGIALADPAPEFLPLESAGGTVVIAVNPISGAINLEAAGVAGLVQLSADTGPVLPALGNINVFGGELINTDNLVANTVTVNLDRGADGTVVAGTGVGSAAIYKTLFSPDGSIVFDFVTDPTAIHMVAPGGGGGGVTNLTADSGVPALPVGGAIQIAGGLNIRTVGSNPPGVITVHVTDDVDLAGHLYATTDIKTSAGNLIADAGNLRLPQTNNLGTEGVITFGGNRYIHQFGDTAGKKNFFAGYRCGNITMTPAVAIGNTGLGYATVEALTTGTYNTGLGYAALSDVTTGTYNTGLGEGALQRVTTGSFNTGLGRRAGYNYTGNESSNICIEAVGTAGESHVLRIGTHGTGDTQQSACYIAGIRDAAAGTSPEMVVIGTIASGYKVWSMPIPGGAADTFITDAGNAVPNGAGELEIRGGDNINVAGAGNVVTVNLDHSVKQPMPKVAPTSNDGVYALFDPAVGVGSYNTDRFMHAWGYTMGVDAYNTFLGRQSGQIAVGSIGLNNTGIGANSLDAYTSGSNNSALGKNALGAVTSGGSNIAIGSSAGSAITTTSYNIYLGNPGVLGETRTMKLGYTQVWGVPAPDPRNPDPVETLISDGTHDTYCYGVYKNTVAYSGTPVYVDHLGKLGTEGGVMFAFRQTTTLGGATGDGTVYVFGTSGGITKDFDNTNSVVVGGAGAPAIFTAPYAGKYVFTASITMSVPASPPVPRPVGVDPLYIVTSNLSYCYTNFIPASTTTVQYVSEIVTTTVYLDAGDTVRWAAAAGTAATAKNISIINYLAPTIPGVGVTTCYATYFTGYRVS